MKVKILLLAFISISAVSKSQIIYHDVNPDTTVSATTTEVIESFYIDLDHDGQYEKELRHFNPGTGNELVELQNNAGLSIFAEQVLTTDNRTKPITINDNISSILKWGQDGTGNLNSTWFGTGDKFLGLRFQKSGQWHYAWVRITCPADKQSVTIKDFAYNSTPGAPINAGQQSGTGIYHAANERDIKLALSGNGIRFINLEAGIAYTLNLRDANGRNVQKAIIKNDETVDITSLASGIYFAVLQGNGLYRAFKFTVQ